MIIIVLDIRVRSSTINCVRQNYATLEDAEEHLGLSLSYYLKDMETHTPERTRPASVQKYTQTPATTCTTPPYSCSNEADSIDVEQLSDEEATKLANKIFLQLAVAIQNV